MKFWPRTAVEREHATSEQRTRNRQRDLPTDPTPTTMRWEIQRWDEEWIALGIEWPVKTEHSNRLYGKMILDDGEFRELRVVRVSLPSDVAAAVSTAEVMG